MTKQTKLTCGVVLTLVVSVYTWLSLRLPVYDEQMVTSTIERNIPTGTSQVQVAKFLDTLKWKDVVYGTHGKDGVAFFPTTRYMRGWWYIKVYFTFKNGRMTQYKMQRIKI